MIVTEEEHGGLSFGEVPEEIFRRLLKVSEIADIEDNSNAAKRVFPNLLDPAEPKSEKRREMESEWRQFVHPELESANHAAIETVLEDLNRAEVEKSKGGSVYAFEIPQAHLSRWYHALNLARLVLAEEYRLPMPKFPQKSGKEIDPERLMAVQVSELYAFLLELLVSRMAEELGL